jgi:hypothetical protein
MDIMELGAIGEAVSAIAVLASLVYLAMGIPLGVVPLAFRAEVPDLCRRRYPPGRAKPQLMNWEAIRVIGEVGGASAVVVSLVYLAAQIR